MMDSIQEKERKIYKRHVFIWKFFWHTIQPIVKSWFNYSCKLFSDIDEPYLVISNHNTDYDPILVGFSFPKQMYYVASEHVYRKGFISKVLHYTFEPIAKMKGSSDTLTVMKMIRTLRSKKNVCLFAEGNRSFNGITGEITEATGKLVKASGAALVTYRLEGGYFTTPRWSYGIRKGKMKGFPVNTYSSEQLKTMSALEITETIKKDIYEDAYKNQCENPIKYKGKNLAKGIRNVLCVCPNCTSIDSLYSDKDSVLCSMCGSMSKFDMYGYLNGNFEINDCKKLSVKDWDIWQTEFLLKLFKENIEKPDNLFFDENMVCSKVTEDHKSVIDCVGTLCLYSDRISIENHKDTNFFFKDITNAAIFGKNTLVFSTSDGNHYEIKKIQQSRKEDFNMRKYLLLINRILSK